MAGEATGGRGRSRNIAAKAAFAVLALAVVGFQWSFDPVREGNLVKEVPAMGRWPWLETPYVYAYLHLFTLIPILALSFDRNVHYYRSWKFLFPAIVVVAAVFIGWDVFFTFKGVWGFNPEYVMGIFLLWLPLEEWLFFITVPFACVFIYECLNFYVRRDLLGPFEKSISWALICLMCLTGIVFWSHMYTATTFLLSGFLLLFHVLFMDGSYRGRFYMAYLASLFPFLLVNGVLTGGFTREPVVLYNPEEFLGWRIGSVPVDDSAYSFAMLLGTVTLYEYFRNKRPPKRELSSDE